MSLAPTQTPSQTPQQGSVREQEEYARQQYRLRHPPPQPKPEVRWVPASMLRPKPMRYSDMLIREVAPVLSIRAQKAEEQESTTQRLTPPKPAREPTAWQQRGFFPSSPESRYIHSETAPTTIGPEPKTYKTFVFPSQPEKPMLVGNKPPTLADVTLVKTPQPVRAQIETQMFQERTAEILAGMPKVSGESFFRLSGRAWNIAMETDVQYRGLVELQNRLASQSYKLKTYPSLGEQIAAFEVPSLPQMLGLQGKPVRPFAFAGGFVGGVQSRVMGFAGLGIKGYELASGKQTGLKVPYSPTLMGGLISSGIESFSSWSLKGSEELGRIGNLPAEYALGNLASDVMFSWLLGEAVKGVKDVLMPKKIGGYQLADVPNIFKQPLSSGESTVTKEFLTKPMPYNYLAGVEDVSTGKIVGERMTFDYLAGFEENVAPVTKLGIVPKSLSFEDVPNFLKPSEAKEVFRLPSMKALEAETMATSLGTTPRTTLLDPLQTLIEPSIIRGGLPYIPDVTLIKSSSFLPKIIGASAFLGLLSLPRTPATMKQNIGTMPALSKLASPIAVSRPERLSKSTMSSFLGSPTMLKSGSIVGTIQTPKAVSLLASAQATKQVSSQLTKQVTTQIRAPPNIPKLVEVPKFSGFGEFTRKKGRRRKQAFVLELGIGEFYYPEPPTLKQISGPLFGKAPKRRKKR